MHRYTMTRLIRVREVLSVGYFTLRRLQRQIPLVCVVAPPAYATYDQVREVFALARTKPACILFFDEIDSFGGVRHGGAGEGEGDNEVQRTMLELLNQLDGFDRRGNVKAGTKQCVIYSIIQ